ncbi:MAG: hypothetical protein IJP33_05695 [Firmicutes bacterium]|nr:hypothetical protein [Bacillota bacterium]
MEIIAMRGKDRFLVVIEKNLCALVNVRDDTVIYKSDPWSFLKFGYFTDPEYDEEILTKIEQLLAKQI